MCPALAQKHAQSLGRSNTTKKNILIYHLSRKHRIQIQKNGGASFVSGGSKQPKHPCPLSFAAPCAAPDREFRARLWPGY